MKNFWLVLWIQIRDRFGLSLMRGKNVPERDKKKQRGSFFGLLFGGAYIMALCAFLEILFIGAAVTIGLGEELLTVVFMVGAIVTLVIGQFLTMSVLFMSKDNEILAALPVKQSTVFATKFTQVYISNFGMFAIFALPAVVIYGVTTAQSALYYVMAVPVLLLMPLIPQLIATLLGMLLMLLVGRSRHREMFITVGSLVMAVALVVGQMSVMTSVQTTTDDPAMLLQSMKQILVSIAAAFPPAKWGVMAMTRGAEGLLWFLLFAASCAVIFVITYFIASKFYERMALLFLETKRSGKKIDVAKTSSHERGVKMALYRKEWMIVLRSPTYCMNSLIGIVLGPLMVLYLGFMGGSDGGMINELSAAIGEAGAEFIQPLITIVMMAGLMFFSTTTTTLSSTAISRESKTLWLVNTIPVSLYDQLVMKYMMSFTATLIMTAASIVTLAIVLPSDLLSLIIAAVLMLVFSAAETAVGLALDVRKPKLNWQTETEAMKQNGNAAISMFVSMGVLAISVVPAVLLMMATMLPWVGFTIVGVMFAAYAVAGFVVLNHIARDKVIEG